MKNNQQIAAKEFSKKWEGRGYEKGDSQSFWLELLQKVLEVEDPYAIISFENQVKLSNTSFIDAYIESTHTLIEQKSIEKDLRKAIPQSDGTALTPFQQAKRYAAELPYSKRPRWMVMSNFKTFHVYDMENPQGEPEVIELANLEKEYWRLNFLVDTGSQHLQKEMEISLKAGEIIGEIYDELLKQYVNPEDPATLRSLNILCVRLVFCLYAEDSGLFGKHSMFHDYLIQFKPGEGDMREGLIKLFEVLNTPIDKRSPYLKTSLRSFPYVNGGLFADKDVEVPFFNDKIAHLILKNASDDFDWSQISPTIFGAVFESTLNPDTRRSGGMHYTSIENIHKVIDPLFLDDLKEELESIKSEPIQKSRVKKAFAYQDKLAGLKFLDPACGSGNFLTETYLSLRRLENEAIKIQSRDNGPSLGEAFTPIKVNIHQFYGIEINDFAVSTATTALWIAESQMMAETEKIMQMDLDFLPLKAYHNIVEGNALRIDWNDVVPAKELNYIMGNPPFVGKSFQTKSQKEDMDEVFHDVKNYGNLDYVSSWYKKACEYIHNYPICVAFVSTNSICQGIAVPPLWKYLLSKDIHIDFAYPTFVWNSEASEHAAVHCVIIGFSKQRVCQKKLFSGTNTSQSVKNINAYLLNAPSIIIEDIHNPISAVPQTSVGSFATDGGGLIVERSELEEITKKEPSITKYIKKYVNPDSFLNGKERYCLWLKDCPFSEMHRIGEIKKRLEIVRNYRLNSPKIQTQRRADTPHLFAEDRQPSSFYLLFPRTSSSKRKYIPIGFLSPEVIAGDTIIVPEASIYHFGILTSNVHMAWMRAFCGRMKSDYRYSGTLIYNTFPWPSPNDNQKMKIERTAQGILDARAKYPDSNLAELYDEVTMPSDLRKAHQENDKAVMEAYGFDWKKMTESECVAELLKMYQKLTSQEK